MIFIVRKIVARVGNIPFIAFADDENVAYQRLICN